MTFLADRDFILEVARGKIQGYTYVRRGGINRDIDAAATEDICPGGTINWQTSAVAMEIISTDVDDVASTGTGARTVKVVGLDSSWNEQLETISMNGTTAVASVNNYRFVDRAEIVTTGSSETNEGDITVRTVSGSNAVAVMPAGYGQNWTAAYTIPAGKTGFLVSWYNHLLAATDGSMEMRLMVAEDGVGWRTILIHELTRAGSGYSHVDEDDLLLQLAQKTRIKVTGTSSAANLAVSTSFSLILV